MDTFDNPVVYLQTHTGCTHSCPICPHPIARRMMPSESMSMETLSSILDNAKDVPEFVLGLQSEPLQDEHLFDKIELIRSKCPGSKIVVETLAKNLTIPIAVSMRDAGVNRVRINVWDKPNPARVRHLHYLGLEVELLVVINKSRRFNHDHLRRQYGEQSIITEVEIHNGRGFVHDFDRHNLRELNEFREPCPRLFQELAIVANGTVVGCQEDYTRVKNLGDATKQSINTIWNSSSLNEFRKLHLLPAAEKDEALKGTICETCTFAR